MMCVFVLTVTQNDVKNVTTPQLVLFIVPYSVAAYSSRTRATLGLAICVIAGGAVSRCVCRLITPSINAIIRLK